MKQINLNVPTGWTDLIGGVVKVALVAFLVLQIKEWLDAGSFDTLATGTDALLIAAALLVLNAILMRVRL